MAIITVGTQSFEASPDKRLVLALEDVGIPVLHRCGGYAKCTTCRVKFTSGEPELMTKAEKQRLKQDPLNLYGKARLSCQILCTADMTLQPLMTLGTADVDSPGKRPENHITPPPEWEPR